MTGRPKEPHNLSHLPPGSLISSLLTFVEKDRVEVSLFQIHFFFFKAMGERNRRQKGVLKKHERGYILAGI